MRQERKRLERLTEALNVVLRTEIPTRNQELLSRLAQIESDLEVIAREFLRQHERDPG